MSQDLLVEEFPAFFEEIHGYPPFPWQTRLAHTVSDEGRWPDVLDLPTGSGKTAALDVAVFHVALEAHRGWERKAPVRIALVVDRRLVVDDAFARAKRISAALASPPGRVTAKVADRLRLLAGGDNPPLLARRLRGGIPREDDWARTPSQPTILCSTVDQVGSRLLFRGYGVSDSMKPVHAGLIGADCLILLDEAHLSEPFRQTLRWVQRYKSESWRETDDAVSPGGVSLLTATPGMDHGSAFHLEEDDYANPTLNRRWAASKPARLIDLSKSNKDEPSGQETDATRTEENQRIATLVREALGALKALKNAGPNHPAIAVVVNRVARARAIFEELRNTPDLADAESILMIGPARPVERDALAEALGPIRTGNKARVLEKPMVIVSTQCIEAGVDIDLDGLITECAPLDALRQRFGRLNRDGREGVQAYAAIVGGAKADAKDAVYDEALGKAWSYLIEHSDKPADKKAPARVDFGLKAFAKRIQKHPIPQEALSPKPDAPVLLPAHLDLLSQTAPIPTADPEVSLYLHGPDRAADAVTVIWRADVNAESRKDRDTRTRRLLLLMPPRATEAIELPVWVVRRWLQSADVSALADIPGPDPAERRSRADRERGEIFRWVGDDERSVWIVPEQIHAGNTIIVPTSYGGVDPYGWNPNTKFATDVADEAALPFADRRFVVRVAPGLLKNDDALLAQIIANADTSHWETMRDSVKRIKLPDSIVANLDRLSLAKGKRGKKKVEVYTDLYGDENGYPRGVVFVAPFGIEISRGSEIEEGEGSNTTEDDIAGSLPGFALSLERHCADVEATAEQFARLAGVSEDRIVDVTLAGHLHDTGKADSRFQVWLAYGDSLGPDPDSPDEILAKSARPIPRSARASSGLPEKWRHEALSVRLAPFTPRFTEAKDPELVLWLVGTHHGHGRPFFPHADPQDATTRVDLSSVLGLPRTLPPEPGPQSLAFDCNGSDWAGLYERLKARYGVWELARMEAILRLADHRASELAGRILRAEKGGVQ